MSEPVQGNALNEPCETSATLHFTRLTPAEIKLCLTHGNVGEWCWSLLVLAWVSRGDSNFTSVICLLSPQVDDAF